MGREEETPQVKTQGGPELPTDVPDYATEAVYSDGQYFNFSKSIQYIATCSYNIEVIEYHSLGKFHSWNFSCEKIHVKIFSSSWV